MCDVTMHALNYTICCKRLMICDERYAICHLWYTMFKIRQPDITNISVGDYMYHLDHLTCMLYIWFHHVSCTSHVWDSTHITFSSHFRWIGFARCPLRYKMYDSDERYAYSICDLSYLRCDVRCAISNVLFAIFDMRCTVCDVQCAIYRELQLSRWQSKAHSRCICMWPTFH